MLNKEFMEYKELPNPLRMILTTKDDHETYKISLSFWQDFADRSPFVLLNVMIGLVSVYNRMVIMLPRLLLLRNQHSFS